MNRVGVNLPVNMLPPQQWEGLKQDLSKGTALYRYSGQEWPFILPTTDLEFQSGQMEYHSPRGPKFEWVYDEEAREPVIQLALRTSAGRAKVEMGWMSNWDYPFAYPTSPWNGQMSLPREWSLKTNASGGSESRRLFPFGWGRDCLRNDGCAF